MRPAACLLVLGALSACGTPVGRSVLGGTCDEQYRQCRQQPGDVSLCSEQRNLCVATRDADNERRAEKERGYEEFLREREEADE